MTEQPSHSPEPESQSQSQEPEPADEARPEGNVGPPEDLESDPAYNPDDPELKRMKGG